MAGYKKKIHIAKDIERQGLVRLGIVMQPIVKVRVGDRGARGSPVENRCPPLVDHVLCRAMIPSKQQTSDSSLTTAATKTSWKETHLGQTVDPISLKAP